MNKTTLAASVRMGAFNFPAQISCCTALNFSVVSIAAWEDACHRELGYLLPVLVYNGERNGFVGDKEAF